MLSPRHLIAWLTLLVAAPFASHADAGCCDWLFGRRQPVVVQYAPVATAPTYAANYCPVPTTSTYAANFGAIPIPMTQPQPNGVYQAQRPAYFDNPSVYTGRPVISARPVITSQPMITNAAPPLGSPTTMTVDPGQTVYRVPTTTAYSLPSTSSQVPIANSYRGSGPVGTGAVSASYPPAVPTGYQSSSGSYGSFYGSQVVAGSSPGLPMTTTIPSGTPSSSMPAATIAPVFVSPPPPPPGGLSRFFGSLLGTRYRSSYYRAPITYYRPVTTVDPVTGMPVSVQQPCTSYVQQLQRTPVGTVQLPPAQIQSPSNCQPIAPPMGDCSYGMAGPYPQSGSHAPSGGIGQVGGIAPSSGSVVSPIPSTIPSSGNPPSYYGQSGSSLAPTSPNLAPLTGSPSIRGDQAPVDRPQLPPPPSESSYREQPDTSSPEPPNPPAPTTAPALPDESPPSYWESKEVEDSTASLPPATAAPLRQPAETNRFEDARYTSLPPIPAPDHYQSPLRQRDRQGPTATIDREQTFEAPPLPPRVPDSADTTSVSTRISVPVRDASMTTRVRTDRPTLPARDRSGWRTVGQ